MGISFKKDSSWQQVSFIFVANGNESFITLGNFSKNDVTGSTGIQLENNFFVFIDDISITPVKANEKLCEDWQFSKKIIYDQDERHEYLRRLIKERSFNAPDTIKLSKSKLAIVDTFILPDILFETGKAGFRPGSHSLIDSLCNRIKNSHIDSVVVEGHTDNKGSYEFNEKLSQERAITVKNYLQYKTGYAYILARGKSFSVPKADNETPEGRQKNRRVEILCYFSE
jgi:outer membrane protein OmpA-like peptidoglycan-associated protein